MVTFFQKNWLVKQIPNSITLVNLSCGSLSIILAFNNQLRESAIALVIAFLADIFDGFAARLLKAQSLIGKELDSLSDMVSFGLAPAVILHVMMLGEAEQSGFSFQQGFAIWFPLLIPFVIPLFAALRLAKFNIDERQNDVFIGLPTPANALMVMSLPLIAYSQPNSFVLDWFSQPWVIVAYAIIVSILMVAPLRLYSLKLKGFSLSTNLYRYLFGIITITCLISLWYTGLFLVVVIYIVYGSLLGILQKNSKIK